ncbi:MAG: transposase, partial [Myxococcales bacterium]
MFVTPEGSVLYGLKKARADGVATVQFTPMQFLARLAALVPPPRSHLLGYHGVFAPNARWRKAVVPGPSTS